MYIFIYCTHRRDTEWKQANGKIAHPQSKVTISELHPNEEYDVRVYAEDTNGSRSEPTILETMTSKYSIIPFD